MPQNKEGRPTWRGINKPRIDVSTPVADWPILMTSREVAIALNISYNRAVALQRTGALPSIPGTNRRRLTPKADVLAHLVRGSEPLTEAAHRYSQAKAAGQ